MHVQYMLCNKNMHTLIPLFITEAYSKWFTYFGP